MPQHNLVAYTLTIHPRGEPDSPLRAGWLDGDSEAPRDLIGVLSDILVPDTVWRQNEGTPNEVSGRILSRERLDQEPTLYGRIRVGGRGQRNDITKASGEEIQVWTDDEVHRPVFYWITAPPQSKRALILTERVGQFGVRSAFWDTFVLQGLREALPDRIPEMPHWYPKRILEDYLEHGSGLSGATLRKVVLEQDENKAIDDPARVIKYGSLEVRVNRKWKPAQDVMEKLLGNQLDMNEAIEVLIPPQAISGPVKNISPDELILSVDFDNRNPISVSVTRDRTPRAGFPVGAIDVDAEGYPLLDAMVNRAKEVQKDVSGALGWK